MPLDQNQCPPTFFRAGSLEGVHLYFGVGFEVDGIPLVPFQLVISLKMERNWMVFSMVLDGSKVAIG